MEISSKNNSVEEIIDKLSENKFVVYGAGAHARKFINGVNYRGLADNFICFAVTRKSAKDSDSVKLIDDIDRDTLIIVAAHEKNAESMEQYLRELGFNKYIVIYPYLIDFVIGKPLVKNVEIDVNDFLSKCLWGDYLAVIYLAIDDIVKNTDGMGKSVYIKTMQLYSQYETAYNRWESLKERIKIYKYIGKPETYNVKLDIDCNFILDGSHRMVLAKYFRIKKVPCDLYKVDVEDFKAIFLGENWLDTFDTNVFTGEEIQQIRDTRCKWLGHI